MIDYEVLEERVVSLPEVKEILKKRKKEAKYEQKLAYEHANKFAKLTLKQAESLAKDLRALELRKLKDEVIVKIIDLLPKSVEDLKVVVSGSKLGFKPEELEKVMEVVKKYVKG